MAEKSGCFGCFGRLGCGALVIAAAVGVWYYRAPIGERIAGWWRESAPALPSTDRENVGAPTEAAVASFREKAEALEAGEADSVVLTANEVASLIGTGLDWAIRQAFDSLRVELEDDRLLMHARYETRHLPDEALGVLDGVLQDQEPLVLGGRMFVEDAGRIRWVIDEIRIRRVPVPRGAIAAIMSRIARTDGDDGFVIEAPPLVAFIRVSPSGVTLKRMRSN